MDEIDDPKLSLIDHLEELRKRIFVMLYVTVAMYVPGFYLAKPAIERLQKYGCPPETELVYTGPMDWFFTQLAMGLVFALLFASPIIAYQIWKSSSASRSLGCSFFRRSCVSPTAWQRTASSRC